MQYVTADDIYDYVKQLRDAESEELTARLNTICVRAQAIVDGALGFTYDGYTDATDKVVYGTSSPQMILPPHDAGSVSAVVYEGSTSELTGYIEQDDGSLYFTGYNPYYIGGWDASRYTVTADWGYGDPPEDVKQVTLELAINIQMGAEAGMYRGFVGEEGNGGLRYIGGLNSQQRAVIAAARKRLFPLRVA